MPKISQERRDARRRQIMEAAKRCFLRNGIHSTSMQDLLAESQLSAGAFYGYFRSKEDVILAIAEENVREGAALVHRLAAHAEEDAGLGSVIASVLDMIRDQHRQRGLGYLAILVWAEMLRSPAIAQQYSEILGRVHAEFVEVVRAYQKAGALPNAVSADALAALLMTIIPGYILQLALDEPWGEAIPEAARALWPAESVLPVPRTDNLGP